MRYEIKLIPIFLLLCVLTGCASTGATNRDHYECRRETAQARQAAANDWDRMFIMEECLEYKVQDRRAASTYE